MMNPHFCDLQLTEVECPVLKILGTRSVIFKTVEAFSFTQILLVEWYSGSLRLEGI